MAIFFSCLKSRFFEFFFNHSAPRMSQAQLYTSIERTSSRRANGVFFEYITHNGSGNFLWSYASFLPFLSEDRRALNLELESYFPNGSPPPLTDKIAWTNEEAIKHPSDGKRRNEGFFFSTKLILKHFLRYLKKCLSNRSTTRRIQASCV